MDERRPPGGIDRRRFLQSTALLAASAGLGVAASPGRASEPEIRRHRTLGRTKLEISDISYGSSRTSDPAVARHALARGINYFDTAEGYQGGRSEEAIGEALEGRRDDVILASKTKCDVRTSRQELMRSLEASLRRLRTDRIDVYFNHAVNDVDRLQNPEWFEFCDRAKQQGKIRFSGFSGHGGRLVECIDYAVEHDLVDVLLVAYNFGQDPSFLQQFTRDMDFVAIQTGLPRALDAARAKGVGVVAMKTLRGARLNDMRPYEQGGATFAQSAFRWTLHDGHVDALVVSMTSKDQVDEYVAASGEGRPGPAETGRLQRYWAQARVRDGYCEHGCSVCEDACPAGVPISEVLRTRMYATDYRDLALAREDYARLGLGTGSCLGCAAPCASACPAGIEIDRLVPEAERLLA